MADAWFETVAAVPQRALLWRWAKTLCPAGVENVLDDLGGGIDSALRDVGKASTHNLTPDDTWSPPASPRASGWRPTGIPDLIRAVSDTGVAGGADVISGRGLGEKRTLLIS